jgi:transposase
LLRKINRHIDFSFIHEKVRPYYCEDTGRPPIDPVVPFKMIFIGYLYGIRSERQLKKEIRTNVAYRWFFGLKLTDGVPYHTTISLNRCTRFKDSNIFQEIFDEIVSQAMKHRMVSGRVLMTDSTHIKANANKNRFKAQVVHERTKYYLSELDKAIEADRMAHQKKPLRPREEVTEEREIKVSLTDLDSGYMYREGKPEGFYYLDNRAVDAKYNVITDVHITLGNVHDSVPYIERLERQMERFES